MKTLTQLLFLTSLILLVSSVIGMFLFIILEFIWFINIPIIFLQIFGTVFLVTILSSPVLFTLKHVK